MRGFGFFDDRAMRASIAIALGALLAIAGCDGDDGDMDAGTDAGDGMMDGGRDDDAGGGDEDAGGGDEDAGGGDEDGGPADGGPTDGGTMIGGGAATSAQIQAVLDATPGSVTLMVDDAVVTYVKPAIEDGVDTAGFFVQAEQVGPALYVQVDLTALSPAPEAGQVVDFQVTTVTLDDSSGDDTSITYASAIDSWNVDSTGNDTSFLVQDVSAVDLVTNLDDYFAELVSLTGVIETSFTFAGTGFSGAEITTTGVTTATGDLRFRVPNDVLAAAAPGVGCTVDIGPTPLWRYQTGAQPSAWRATDFSVTACPTPTAAGELVVTEIGYSFTGADDDLEFIEIYNPDEDAGYDIGGCILSDSAGPTDASALTIPGTVIVGPEQYVVIAGSSSEITGDAVLPTALAFDDTDVVQLDCGLNTIDTVDWSSGGLPNMEGVSAQLDAGLEDATSNDDLAAWCLTPDGSTYGTMSRRGTPGAANPTCPCASVTSGLVFNEVDYDQSGADGAEFVELLNTSGGPLELCDIDVVFVNGNDNEEYERVPLAGSVATDGYVVVVGSGSSVAPTDASYVTGGGFQNGAPDAIALISASTGTVIDFITYEGTFSDPAVLDPSGTTTIFTIPTALNDSIGTDGGDGSLVLCGTTGTPSSDWASATTTTPGAANSCP